jgi:hypothetical protein
MDNKDGALDIIEMIDDGTVLLNESQTRKSNNLSK